MWVLLVGVVFIGCVGVWLWVGWFSNGVCLGCVVWGGCWVSGDDSSVGCLVCCVFGVLDCCCSEVVCG